MASRRLLDARPVRSEARSCLKALIAPSMRRWMSWKSPLFMISLLELSRSGLLGCLVGYHCAAAAATQDFPEIALIVYRIDDYRNVVFPCKRDCGRVHDRQALS